MSEEEKKDVDVRDLKPSKDAKGGGRRGHRQGGGGHGNRGSNDLDTPGRGKGHPHL